MSKEAARISAEALAEAVEILKSLRDSNARAWAEGCGVCGELICAGDCPARRADEWCGEHLK